MHDEFTRLNDGNQKESSKNRSAAHEKRRKATKSTELTAGEWFEKLAAVQARLRARMVAPWDREQTHASLRTYLIEEAYEVLEALESGDDAKFAEEMGDLLLQIVFHSEIAKEEGRFSVSDVIREVHDKMVRRHPHVLERSARKEYGRGFEEVGADQERGARGGWEEKWGWFEKQEEKAGSLLDGVSRLPAALEGFQLTRRAAPIGFDWDSVEGVFDKMNEEAAELRHALSAKDAKKTEEEMGDFAVCGRQFGAFSTCRS